VVSCRRCNWATASLIRIGRASRALFVIECGHGAVAADKDDAGCLQRGFARRDTRAGVVVAATPPGTRAASCALAADPRWFCCLRAARHRAWSHLAASHRHHARARMLTPGGPLPASPLTAQVVAEKVATWAETGIGILYSQATGAHVCFSRAANYYVALNADHIAGRAR
jgi:hypothetical protein